MGITKYGDGSEHNVIEPDDADLEDRQPEDGDDEEQ